jgi:1-acyl-sn-glycerol-3-phosphate acyltransferase
MKLLTPLSTSRLILDTTRTSLFTVGQENLPGQGVAIVVSNHRSFLDAPILIQALGKTLPIACHHYMGKTPLLRELIGELGCFPFDTPEKRHRTFFRQATDFLQSGRWIGLFPEGGSPMLNLTAPRQISPFQSGFAHLALRCPVENLSVLPVAILSESETVISPFPVRLLRWLDTTEPLFDQDGWHPVVFYHRVKVAIGRPYGITESDRSDYQGKQGKKALNRLIGHCQSEIGDLLLKG